MEEQIELKLFTVADLKAYFLHNQPVKLLSEKVISHTRAYATINNPYAEDDTAIVSALFVDGEVAAFTYVIPDEVNGKRVYWNTVLSVDPKFEGRGYGFIVIGQMLEVYGDKYFDLDAVPASVENLKYAGLTVDYMDQYILEQKHINTDSLKGKLAAAMENMRVRKAYKTLQRSLCLENDAPYTLRYTQFIDDQTYAFIREYGKNDLFLRSQAMLNWILSYPLGQESPLANRVPKLCAFVSTQENYRLYAVHVSVEDKLVGLYICRKNKEELYMAYLYYAPEFEQIVFRSIVEHIFVVRPNRVFTSHRNLTEYLKKICVFAHERVYKKSFSYPESFVFDRTKFIQAGDGDNMA